MKNIIKYISLLLSGISLFGCQAYELAMLHPVGQFDNNKPKNSQSVHLIGLQKDLYGNGLSAYLKANNTYYRELFLYPAPKNLYVECNELIGNGMLARGYKLLTGSFELGKTYYIYCEKGPEDTYKVISIEKKLADSYKEKQPNDFNKVTFITNGRNPNTMWLMSGTQITGLVDWNGKLKTRAELVGPRDTITVFCRAEGLYFPVKGNFKVGKTYKVECAKGVTDQKGYPKVMVTDLS